MLINEPRCRFHQHLTRAIFVRNFGAKKFNPKYSLRTNFGKIKSVGIISENVVVRPLLPVKVQTVGCIIPPGGVDPTKLFFLRFFSLALS